MHSPPSSQEDEGHARLTPTAVGVGGFTLIEILTGLAAGVLIILAVLQIFSISRTAVRGGNNSAEAVQNARVALERMSRDLRQAEELVTTLPATDSEPDAPPPSEIEFQDGHDPDALTYIRYYLDGTDLHREQSYYAFPANPSVRVLHNIRNEFGQLPERAALDDQLIAEGVSALQFWGEELIGVRITTARGDAELTTSTGILGRNLVGI